MLQVPVVTGEKLGELYAEAMLVAPDSYTRSLAKSACNFFENDGFFDSIEDYYTTKNTVCIPCAVRVKGVACTLSAEICAWLEKLDKSIQQQRRFD